MDHAGSMRFGDSTSYMKFTTQSAVLGGGLEIETEKFKLDNLGTLTAQSGSIAGWDINQNYILKSISGNTRLYISAEANNTTNNIQEGLQLYRDDSALAAGDVKIVRVGGLSDTTNLHAASDYGLQVIKRQDDGSGYENILYIGKSTQQIAGWDFDVEKISKTNIDIHSTNKTIQVNSGDFYVNLGQTLTSVGALSGHYGISARNGSSDVTYFRLDSNEMSIAGWNFDESELSGTNAKLKSSGVLSLGTGTDAYGSADRIYIDGSNGDGRMSIGTGFKFTDGVLTIDGSATIGGWSVGNGYLFSSDFKINAETNNSYIAIGSAISTPDQQDSIFLGESSNGVYQLTIKNSDASKFFKWDGSDLSIAAGNFELNTSGNITATGGTIAGWTITTESIESKRAKVSAEDGNFYGLMPESVKELWAAVNKSANKSADDYLLENNNASLLPSSSFFNLGALGGHFGSHITENEFNLDITSSDGYNPMLQNNEALFEINDISGLPINQTKQSNFSISSAVGSQNVVVTRHTIIDWDGTAGITKNLFFSDISQDEQGVVNDPSTGDYGALWDYQNTVRKVWYPPYNGAIYRISWNQGMYSNGVSGAFLSNGTAVLQVWQDQPNPSGDEDAGEGTIPDIPTLIAEGPITHTNAETRQGVIDLGSSAVDPETDEEIVGYPRILAGKPLTAALTFGGANGPVELHINCVFMLEVDEFETSGSIYYEDAKSTK